MAAASSSSPHVRSLICATKRLRVSPPTQPSPCPIQQTRQITTQKLPENLAHELAQLRLPRAVQATYMDPLKRAPTHDTKVCDLQLRSYSVRNLEVFADFALRAAYYLKLPASGPRPLPRIVERWTVPRGNFVHKKSQENFERVTLRRQVQIKDGHPENVAIWLAFLQKYRYYGVGMKANMWDYSDVNVVEDMDRMEKAAGEEMSRDGALNLLGGSKGLMERLGLQGLEERIHLQPFKGRYGASGPMGGAGDVPIASKRIERFVVPDTSAKKATEGREGEAAAASAAAQSSAGPDQTKPEDSKSSDSNADIVEKLDEQPEEKK